MNSFEELQKKHLDLLRRYETNKESAEFIKDVREYIDQAINGSREISDSRERNQVRANLRFWGAYIYDHTGTYPNLNLIPSEGKAEPPPPKVNDKRVLNWRGILILALILLAVVFIPRLFLGNRPYSQQPSITNTPIDSNSLFATPLGGPTFMGDVQSFATGTAIALLTQPAFNSPTVSPTATSLPFGSIFSIGFIPRVIDFASECSKREIAITWRDFKWDTGILPNSSAIENAVAYLSLLDTGEVVSQANLVPDGDPTIFELDNPGTDQSYFLQIKHPTFLFEPTIIQFTSDCDYNHLSLSYAERALLLMSQL